ncbi:MAG: T9SS type A sorting domain-containing protein [Flavobacteriia bacterium]
MNSTNTYCSFRQKLKLLLLLISSSFFANAQSEIDLTKTHYGSKYVKSIDRKIYNLEDFSTPSKKELSKDFLNQFDKAFSNHPDLGFARHRVYDEAIEMVDKRTANGTQYLLPDGKIIFSSTEKPLNYLDQNGWYREINSKLNASPLNNVYTADKQPVHKTINVSNANTKYKTSIGDITINQNTKLKFQTGQTISNQGQLNSSNYKIGENGMFISNAFEGIDAQIIFLESGAIKTNYIIKDRSSVPTNAEFMIFEDIITIPEGLNLTYDESDGIFNGNGSDWEGTLILKNSADEGILFYQPAVIYDDNYVQALAFANEPKFDAASQTILDEGVGSDALSYGAYRIERVSATEYKIALVVSVEWLLANDRAYPVVIDPTTFLGVAINTTASCAVRIGGGGNSATVPVDDPRATYGGVGCHSTTSVLPAGYMLVTTGYPVLVQAGYVSTGCVMGNTFQTFYGPCGRDPRASGFFWFCNTAIFAGTCTGTNTAMDGILSRCTTSTDGELCSAATPPSCSDQTLNFTLCLQTRCTGGTGGTCYAVAGSPSVRGIGTFRVDLVGEKITTTLSGGGNICPSTATTLNLATRFGVPNALSTANCTDQMGGTYSWTATCSGGTLGAASGTTTTTGTAAITWTSPAAPGSYTVTVTTCNTGCNTPAGTMCDVQTVTYTVGTAIVPTLSDVTLCNTQSTTLTLGNTQAGYTYTWYDGPTIASASLGTGTTETVGPFSNTSRQYTVRATAPCASTPITVTVTWGPIAAPTVGASPTICINTSATLTASCGTDCEWYTVAVGGTSVDSDGSYTTPAVGSTTTYYVETNIGAGCVSARTPITVTIGNLTVNATPAASTEVCTPGTLGFNATTSGGTFVPFDDEIVNDVNSANAANNRTCTDPSAADCQDAGDVCSSTLTTPANVANPLDATSIQSVCVRLTDGCAKDTKIWLMSPGGTIFLLSQKRSNVDNEVYNTCFTATATNVIANVDDNSTTSTPANTFRPAQGMLNAAFVGENPYAGTGTWTLYVNDDLNGCSTTIGIDRFSMTFRRDPPVTYTWSAAPLAQLSSSTIVNPTFTAPVPDYNYTYTLTVVDKRGCTGTDNVNVFCGIPLPVTFSQFSGVKQSAGNQLIWATSSESQSDYFNILRSNDGITFETIGKVKAAGNSSITTNYSFLDESPRNGINYYKLKQVDFNGEFIETEIIQLVNSLKNDELLLSPNPASKSLDLSFNSEKNSSVLIQIIDSKGSVVEQIEQKSLVGINTLKINVDKYSFGIYNVNVNIDGKTISSRFVKN